MPGADGSALGTLCGKGAELVAISVAAGIAVSRWPAKNAMTPTATAMAPTTIAARQTCERDFVRSSSTPSSRISASIVK